MKTAQDSPLGTHSAVSDRYDPGLLFAIARAPKRADLGIDSALPFRGMDIWNAYELSWLDRRGKPCVALGTFSVPADSSKLIESKSLKLYLNGFNQTRFESTERVHELLRRDLSLASGGDVAIDLRSASDGPAERIEILAGESIDDLDIAIDHYGPPRPEFLQLAVDRAAVDETLVTHLFKSNCPVTGQPDWASVQIAYRGARIDRAGLLRYLIAFRGYDDFHEHCVERIFVDLMQRCAPAALTVVARYTRRGGLDINPWRSNNVGAVVPNARLTRQ